MAKLVTCNTCGKPVSSQASSCPNCGQAAKTKGGCLNELLKWGGIFLVAGIVAMTCSTAFDIDGKKKASNSSENNQAAIIRPKLGDECVLLIPNSNEPVAVSVDRAAYDALFKALAAKDDIGFAQLVQSGQVLMIPSGTRVKLIDAGVMSHTVRILEGDHFGESGWVPVEFVKK